MKQLTERQQAALTALLAYEPRALYIAHARITVNSLLRAGLIERFANHHTRFILTARGRDRAALIPHPAPREP